MQHRDDRPNNVTAGEAAQTRQAESKSGDNETRLAR